MNYFCTLFDSNYLSRGLTMYKSLKEHCPDFHLFILAFDDKSAEVLNRLNLDDITVILLQQFEDEKLLAIKGSRSNVEYFWTCASSLILYCILTFKLESCIYLDADLYFFASPQILIDEMPQTDSVMISPHRFIEKEKNAEIYGIYCVDFIIFKNTEEGIKILKWWRDACLEWCHARVEDGKYGDQKYLDNWPAKYKGVYVHKNPGAGVAPWNLKRYSYFKKNNIVYCIERGTAKEFQLLFYHFSGLKFFKNNQIRLCFLPLPGEVKELIYKPYLLALELTKISIEKIDGSFDPHGALEPD
jgi:hypothetical protein